MNRWFAAQILMECNVEGPADGISLAEESTRLILAQNEAEARVKAEIVGRSSEHQYKNDRMETVTWRYVKVLELQDLGHATVADGMEVWSRLIERN